MVKFARPSEADVRQALEGAQWDAAAAQPAIAEAVRRRIEAVQVGAQEGTRLALSLCDWSPGAAAQLLSLQLQRSAPVGGLPELHEALQCAAGDLDRAEAILSLLPGAGRPKDALALLESCSVEGAKRLLAVQKRFPNASTTVAQEVLRRNDNDPHAACEMLVEFEKRVRRVALESVAAGALLEGEDRAIAETAMNSVDWEPAAAFAAAKSLAPAVVETRQLVQSRAHGTRITADMVLPALTATKGDAAVAASLLLGVPVKYPQREKPSGRLSERGPRTAPPEPASAADEDLCALM